MAEDQNQELNSELQNQDLNQEPVQQDPPVNGFPVTANGKVTVPKKNVDYFGLKFYGNNDLDVKDMQKSDPTMNLTMMPKEQAFEHYKDDADAAGLDWNPETFNQMYDQAAAQYAEYKKGMYDVGVNYDRVFNRRHNSFHADAISPIQWDPRSTAYDFFPEEDTRFVVNNSEITRVKTDDEFITEDLKWYKPIVDDNAVANKFMYGEDYSKNRTYKEIEVGGRKMKVGDLEADYDKFFGKMKFSSGPEGQTVLAIKYDEKGLPYAEEVSMYDKVHGDAIMSTWGPRSMRQSWYENLWNSSVTNTIAKIPQASVGFLDWMDDIADEIDYALGDETALEDDAIDQADKFYRNYGSFKAVKTPHNIIDAGFMDNAQAFWWNAGGALGSVAQMVLTRKATGAFGKVFGMSDEAANSFGAYMGSGTMAITAADGFKQSMIENGISEDMQLLLYGPALLGSFLVERTGSNILDDGLQAFYAKNNIKEYVDQGIKQSVKDFGLTSASQMTKEQASATGKKLWSGILNQGKSLGGKTYDLSKRGIMAAQKYSPVSIKAAWEEGTEEVKEGVIYSSLESLHDMYQNYSKQDSRNLDRYSYIQEGDNYYEVDNVTSQKRRVTEQTYNKLSEGQQIKPGQGMFAEYNPEMGFVSNWASHASEDMVQDFILGAFAGGITAGSANLFGKKDVQKERILQDYAINGKGEMVRQEFDKMHKAGLFGPTDITPDNQPLDPNNKDHVSLNDMGYQTALKELEEAETIFRMTGISDGDKLKEMMQSESGMNLLREAYDNASNQRQLQSEIDELNKELSGSSDPQMIKNIQEQIDDKNRLKEDYNLQLADIRSGDRMRENVSNTMIKEWSSRNNASMIDPEGKPFVPGVSQIKRANDRYDQKKTEEINRIKEAEQKRVQLENEVGEFTGESTNLKNVDQESLFGRISDIQKKASEVGLSETGTKSMMDKLQGIRSDILNSLDQYFNEEQLAEAQGTSEATGETLQETLMSMVTPGSSAETAHKLYNDLDASIKSFNVEKKPEIKVGDFVQWTQGDQSQFDQPRKLEKISEDGEFGFVEGSDVGIPMSQLSDPTFTGERIKGAIPSSFDENTFKRNFYDTYVDTQGNEVSISKTMEDLSSRKMNDEDMRTLELLNQAISNNAYLASVNKNVLDPLSKDVKFDLGKYRPNPESTLTDDQFKSIIADLNDKHNSLNALAYMQQMDVNDKKNRESKLRFNDYKIRNYILDLASDVEHIELDDKNEIVTIKAQISDALDSIDQEYATTKFYNRNSLDQIDPLLVKAETILHHQLNGENRNEIIKGLANSFKLRKGLGNKGARVYHNADEFVMHDFDNVFNYESFVSPVSTSSDSDMAKKQFAVVYFTNHLQSIDRLDPKTFFDYYANNVAGMDLESGQVPSYEQIKSIYHTTAFMVNHNNDLLWSVQDILTGKKNETSKAMHFNRALFVRGFAGTGKTSLVIKYSANIYSDIMQRDLVIDTSAPSTELQKSLASHLVSFRANATSPGMNYNELIDHINNDKSGIKNTDLIIIDEASNLNKTQIQNLRETLQKSKANGRISLMFLGDQSQMTSINSAPNELVAVERVMERTMPTTEVFRSGTSDISNLQNSYRNAIFKKKDAVLPKGTYDKEKNNGLHYHAGTKREMYDQFVSDLNTEDVFKKNNTALIVYTKADREAAMNYVRKSLNDANMDLDSKVKTIEEGEFSAQGLEYGRIYVAIDEADAQHLYNPAMLTAISRAKRIDDDHNGFASVLSTKGFSEEGNPIIVEVKTASSEDIERHKNWISNITGQPINSSEKTQKDISGAYTDVTVNDFNNLKANMDSILSKGKIEFTEGGFESNGLKFRYKIKGKPVQSVTQKLSGVTTESESERTLDPHAKRGNAIHRILEAYLIKQQKRGGKLFTKADVEAIKGYVTSYNEQVDKWNETAKEDSKLETIQLDADEVNFESNKFIQDVISNIAIPVANKLNQGGRFSLPETVVGIYFNDIAGTMDIVDHVGMDGSVPVVDIYDLKTLSPGSYRFFGDGNVESKLKLGVIESPAGDTYAASGLNKALSQLGTYKAIYEKGDPETGLKPVKVRNVNIIKSSITGSNEVSSLMNDDFVRYDSESSDFKKFKDYGQATVDKGVILQEKNNKSYDHNHSDLGSVFTDTDGNSFEVTGMFTDVDKQGWVEINGDVNNPVTVQDYEQMLVNGSQQETSEDPTTQTVERRYKQSSLNHSQGQTFSFGTASSFFDNGKAGWANDHFRFKTEFFKVLGNRMNSSNPNGPKVDLIFHPEYQLINDKGELQTFKNVVATHINKSFMPDAVRAAKNLSWAKEMSDSEIAKELENRNYLLLSTLAHPDSHFGKTERDIDYTDQAQVQKLMERIKEGFTVNGVADQYKTELVKYHTDLAAYRALGAKTPNEVFATVRLNSIKPGAVVYDGNQKSFDNFMSDLNAKGYKIGKPYFGSKLYAKKDDKGNITNVASWAVDVWRISPSVDGSRIILRTAEFNDVHYTELKKSIDELRTNKATTQRDINQSLAMIFIRQNRSFLIDPVTGGFNNQLIGLSDVLKVDGFDIDIQVNGKKTIPSLINSLSKAVDLLNNLRKDGNRTAINLRQAVPFTIGDNNMRIIPPGMESKLFTSASDVQSFGVNLSLKSIDTKSDTGVYNGVTSPSKSDEEILKKMGFIDPNPNSNTDGGDILFSEEEDMMAINPIPSSDPDQSAEMEPDDSFYYFAKKYFGDIQLINRVKKDVSRVLIDNSDWNRNLNTESISISDMISKAWEHYSDISRIIESGHSAIDVKSESRSYTDLSEISGDTVHLLHKDPNAFSRYFNYVIGKDQNLFFAIVDRALPNLDVKKLKKNDLGTALQERVNTFKDKNSESLTEEQIDNTITNENSQTSVMDSLDSRSFTDTLSALVHLHINHIPLKQYTSDEISGDIKSKSTGNYANPKTVHKSLVDAAQMSNWADEDTADLNRIERWRHHFLNIAMSSGVGTPTYNHLMSFYEIFFSEDPAHMSHMFLRDNSIRVNGADSYIQSSTGANADVVKAKGVASDNLLSAIYAHFASVSSKKNMQMELKFDGTNSSRRQKSQSLAVGNQITSGIKSRMNNALFSLSENGIEINPDVAEKLTDGPNQKFRVNSSGVFDIAGGKSKKLIGFTTNNGRITSFELSKDAMPQDLKDLLNVLNIKELVYTSTLKEYFNTESDNNPDPEKRKDRAKIAEIVGMTMLTTKAAVNPVPSETALLDAYYKENAYTKDSLEDLNDDGSVDMESTGTDVYKPSDLYRLLENLSKTQSDIQLNNHADFFYNVKGDKVYRHTNGSTFFRIFGNGDVSGKLPSSGLKKFTQNTILSEENLQSLPLNPLVMNTPDGVKVLNTIMDPNSGHDIVDVYMIDGTKGSFKSAAHGSDMIDLDFADFAINGMFVNDVVSGKKIQNIKLPFQQISNKRGIVVTHNFGSNKFKANETGIQIDRNWRDESIIDIFRYHNNARRVSYLKWRNVLNAAAGNEVVDATMFNAWMSDPESFANMLQDAVSNNISGRVPLVDFVKQSASLIENKDYTIDKAGNLLPGAASMMNVDSVYNWRNFNRLNKAIQKGNYSEVIDSMFYKRNMDSAYQLKRIGFELDKSSGSNTALYKARTGDKKGYDINPTIESFLFAFHIANHHLSQVAMGDTTQYKDFFDVVKRGSGPFAPAWTPDTSSPHGIGKLSKAVILDDIQGETYQQLESIFGYNGSNVETDGLGIINPISLAILKRSYGGDQLGVIGEGMLKPVYFKNDLLTNDAVYLKYALLPMTEQVLRNSSIAKESFRKMVGDEIFNMWMSGKSFDELADYVVENSLQNEIIMQVVFKSGNKTGNRAVQNFNSKQWIASLEVDNDFFGIQLNASQDIERTDNLSGPSQLEAVIGVGAQNSERVDALNKIKTEISTDALKEMSKNFIENGRFDSQKFEEYLRELGIKSSEKTGDITKFAEMLNDKEVDINIPTQRTKLVQQLMNRVTSEAIKPRWNGVRMSQAPGFFFPIYNDADGNSYTESDAIKFGIPMDSPRSLQPMKFYSDEDFKNEITSREEFDSLLASGQVFLKHAEVIMPFSYFEKFGLKEYIDADPTFSLNDVFMIQLPDGNLVNLRALWDDDVETIVKSAFEKPEAKESTEGEESVEETVISEPTTFLQTKFKSAGPAIEFLRNFRESLLVVHNRIPTSSSSFASAGEIVAWINDNGNTVFTSSQKNILDGGDYDIDQLNMYFKYVNNNGKIVIDNSKQGKINSMFDIILDYYNDPSNAEIFMKKLTLKKLEDQVAQIKDNQTRFKGHHNDFGSNLYSYDNIKQGDALVGIFANIVKTYSYMAHVATKTTGLSSKVEISADSLNSVGEYISNVIERFLNAALDNVKDSILGYLGATEDAGNIIGAAAIKGMDEIEIGNFIQNEVVIDVFRKMKYSKRVANARKLTIHDAIDNKIFDIEQSDSSELREELNLKIAEAKAKLGTSIEDIPVDDFYEEDGIKYPMKPSQIYEMQVSIYSQWDQEYQDLLNQVNDTSTFDEVKQNQLDVLYRFRDLAYFGESISRLNSITKIDSNGIPVFDYQIDKQIRDIEYNLGMPLTDFLAGKKGSEDWYKSRKNYITFEEQEKLDRREPAIRSYLDLQKITRELPHVMAYLNALNEAKGYLSNSFIRNSKMMNEVRDLFLGKMKMDWFNSERSYYSFYNELDSFMVASYFGTQVKEKFQTLYGITKGQNTIDVSTREGRYQFGIEFPAWITGEINRIQTTVDSDLSPKDLDLKNSLFLNSIGINSTPSGDFIEFKNSWKLTEDDYRDLRSSFKSLPASMKKKFYIYQLSKDGFNFAKGGLYEAMDNDLFRQYSKFLDSVKISVDSYGSNKEHQFDFMVDGVKVSRPLSDLFKDVFLKDVGYYSDDMNLLPNRPKDGFEPHLVPDQHKVREKVGSWSVYKVKQKGVEGLFQGSAKKTFNGYDPLNSTLTTMDVIKKISNQTYRLLKSGAEATIKFNGKVDYKLVQAYIADGSLVQIKSKTANSITIVPIKNVDPFKLYQSTSEKKTLLESIVLNSKNEVHSKAAKYILDNIDQSFFSKGYLNFTNEESDVIFNERAALGKKTNGHYDSGTRAISFNMSQIQDATKIEKTFLHEMGHDLTFWALNLSEDEANKMGEKGDRIKGFQSNVKSIYAKAKEYADAEGRSDYGLKDEFEFISEALSNPKFQSWLSEKPYDETVGIGFLDKVGDLFRALMGSIKNLIGIADSDAPYTMLDQILGLVDRHMNSGDYTDGDNKSGSTILFSEDSEPESEINTTKDIISHLQPDGFAKTHSQYKEEQLVNDIYNSIDSKTGVYYYNGEKFFFKSKDGAMMDELSAKSKIKNEILPKFTEFENNYKKSVIGWLNNGAQVDGSLPGTYFPKKGGTSRYNAGTLSEMRRLIDHDVNDFYVRYSEIKDNPDFNHIPYIEEFEGYDPIIAIHKSIDGEAMSISIFDATSLRLNKKGILEGNIFKKFIKDDYEARNRGIFLGNNEGDTRRLLLGLQVMAMKSANPDLKIKHVGVLGVSNKSVDSTWVYMEEFLDNIKAMSSIQEFKNSLPGSIQDVINDQSLYSDNYDQPWIFMLRRKFQENIQQLSDIDGQEYNVKKMNDSVSQMDAYLNGEGSKDEVLQMMIHRMNELEDKFKKDDELLNDKEYIYLSNTVKEMSSIPTVEKNGTKDLDRIKSFLAPTVDISHDVINWAQEKIYAGMRIVQDKVRDFQNEKFFPILKDFNDRYFKKHPEQRSLDYLQDLSGKKFLPLFKTRTVKDQTGNEIEINSLEVHWDENDADTKEALRSNKISQKDVEFGKFVVETIEDQMIQNIMHSNRHQKGYKIEDAKKDLDRKWRKGMIPAMSGSVNEMLMKKDAKSMKAAYKKFMSQLTNLDDIFDEVDKQKLKDTKRQRILKEMSDFFMNQIGLDSDVYGSDSRMKIMGLRNDLTGPVLFDPIANQNISTNLELITMYLVASSERKRVFDKKVLPYVNAAQTMLHNPELSKLDGDQEISKSYFQNYVNSVLKGMPETLDSKILGVNVDAAISTGVQIASFNGLALNVPVAATSALMNAGQFMNSAISNDMATNGLYGKKEALQAIKMFGTKEGRQFIEGVMDMYKVADRSERDLLHNPRMKVTNKNVFNSHHAFWLNWYTDYNVRGIVAVAQMIKDGSIDAYHMDKSSGKLVYDESKDPNFQGEEGKHFKEFVKQRLVEDGVMQSVNDKMPRGYDNKMAAQLKHLADKHVIGNIDDATKGRFGRTVGAKPWMQFISFLPNKLVNYFGSTKASAVGGRYVTKKNEAGEMETAWEQTMQEGIFTTFKNLHSELRANKYKSMKGWSEMKPHERYNVTKFGVDMMSFTILYGLYAGLTADWDDEEKGNQAMINDSRFMKVFKYAALDYVIWNPLSFAESLSAIPTLEQAQRMAGIFVGDFSGVERSLPLSTTVRSFAEVLTDEEENNE